MKFIIFIKLLCFILFTNIPVYLHAQTTIWEFTQSPSGIGLIYDLISRQDLTSTWYAATDEGVFVSYDSGKEWENISPPEILENYYFQSLAYDLKHGILYAGRFSGESEANIFRYQGGIWNNISIPNVDDAFIESLITDQYGNLYAGLDLSKGVYKLPFGEHQWKKTPALAAQDPSSINVLLTQKNTLYAGTNDGVYISENGGSNWHDITPNNLPFQLDVRSMTINNNGKLVVGTGGSIYSDNIYSYYNNEWKNVSIKNVYNAYVHALVFDNDQLYAGLSQYYGLYQSTDDGSTWNYIEKSNNPYGIYDLLLNNNVPYISTGYEGLYKSTSKSNLASQKWELVKHGVVYPSSITTDYQGNVYASFIDISNNIYRYETNSWVPNPIPNIPHAAVHSITTDKHGILYAGLSSYSGVYKSYDKGNTWQATQAFINGNPNNIYMLKSDGDNIYAAANTGLYFSNDQGEIWQNITPPELMETPDIRTIAVDSNHNRIYVGTYYSPNKNLYRYQNKTWENVSLPHAKKSYIRSIDVDNDGNLYAGLDNHQGIFQLPFDNDHWVPMPTIGSKNPLIIYQLETTESSVYAGTEQGIFCYRNAWQDITDNLPNPYIKSMKYDSIKQKMYLGLQSEGIYSTMQPTTCTGIY